MGNGSSQEEEEFHEGMLEISDRGLGSFRLVSIRDIFDKPLLTTSESSCATTEDLTERCPCRCHEKLENGVEHCCRCNRPKITEPADGCSCQCHKALQEQPMKCCICRTSVDPSNSSTDNQLEEVSSEISAGNSCDNRSNLQMVIGWIFQPGMGEYPTSSSGDNHPKLASPEESSSSSANRWGLQMLSGWIFQTSTVESQNNESARNQVKDMPEETTSNSSWVHLSETASPEESQGNPATGTWWDFQMISYWLHQTDSAEAQCSCPDVNLLKQATSEEC